RRSHRNLRIHRGLLQHPPQTLFDRIQNPEPIRSPDSLSKLNNKLVQKSVAPQNAKCSKAAASTMPATLAPKSSNTSRVTTTPTANTLRSDTKPRTNSKPRFTQQTKQQIGPKIGCTSDIHGHHD